MNPEPMELLSAFIDGEEIEPAALAEALTAPGAREALRDFALLRAEVQEDDSTPSPEAYLEIRKTLAAGERAAWHRRIVPVPAPALAAVMVLTVALAVWTILKRSVQPSPREPSSKT